MPWVGIDLGTTSSCVGVWLQARRVEIIPNERGNRTTPALVTITDSLETDSFLVGEDASMQWATNQRNTIFDVTRLLGRHYSDADVQTEAKRWPFQLRAKEDDHPYIEIEHQGECKCFSPEEISAMIFRKMKQIAGDYLGTPVDHAVLSVPAYFNDRQRQATRKAATLAGLEVQRITNEPTAAAMAYGLDRNTPDDERHILVFDLGGGTLDITLLTVEEDIFEVRATAGNMHLGGNDFDSRLVDHFVSEFNRKHQGLDIRNSARSLRRLRTACERAKRTLSFSPSASVELDALFQGIDFYSTISQARFGKLCEDLFRACVPPIEEVLRKTKMSKHEVHEVVLAGGSSRMPKIQQLVKDFFNGKETLHSLNPEEVATYGAAILAAALDTRSNDAWFGMAYVDVAPLSLGVQTEGGIMTPVFPRNTMIPGRRTVMFSTDSDNQSNVSIRVYEGERAMTKDNNLLGTLLLSGIPPAPRGVPQIEVSFEIDAHGILHVCAIDKATSRAAWLTITGDTGRLTASDVQRLLTEAEETRAEDEILKANAEAKNALNHYLSYLHNILKDDLVASRIDPTDREEIALMVDTISGVGSMIVDVQKKEIYEVMKKKVESVVSPILTTRRGDIPSPRDLSTSHLLPSPAIHLLQ